MFKKVSTIILALVLCLSAIVVPATAAAELNGTKVAYALEWDQEYYNPGDTATLYLYLAVADDVPLFTGTITIGLNSQFISPDDNDPASCLTAGELCESYYKDLSTNTGKSAATYQGKIEAMNTAEENATYDWYIRTGLNKNTGGTHPNAANNKDGLYGSEIDPTVPFITYTFTVSADAPMGSVIPAAITSGCAKITPIATAQLAFKYYTNPGAGTTSANIAADQFDVSKAVATASVGKPATHECTPAEAVQENVVPATCGADGSHEDVVYCSGCGAELSRTPVVDKSTGDHVYATVVDEVPATCTVDGSITKACGCGAENKETIPAIGHKYKSTKTNPTCTEEGYTTNTCSNCGDVTKTDIVPAKGHTYKDTVTAPTCEEDGFTKRYCPICKEETIIDPTEATGHNYEATVTAPTCEAEGYTTQTCKNCNHSYVEENKVPATGHKYEVTFVKQPTCAKDGYTEYTCTACKHSYEEPIAALNHKYDDGTSALVKIPAIEPTCKVPGREEGEQCERCNTYTISPKTIPVVPHDYVAGEVVAPTYKEQGYTIYTCSSCGDVKKDDFKDKLEGVEAEITKPEKTEVLEGQTVTLEVPTVLPEGFKANWSADNDNFTFVVNEDGSITITPAANGSTTFKVTITDANGLVVSEDSVMMTAVVETTDDGEEEEAWWMKLIKFIIDLFKKLIEAIVGLVGTLGA